MIFYFSPRELEFWRVKDYKNREKVLIWYHVFMCVHCPPPTCCPSPHWNPPGRSSGGGGWPDSAGAPSKIRFLEWQKPHQVTTKETLSLHPTPLHDGGCPEYLESTLFVGKHVFQEIVGMANSNTWRKKKTMRLIVYTVMWSHLWGQRLLSLLIGLRGGLRSRGGKALGKQRARRSWIWRRDFSCTRRIPAWLLALHPGRACGQRK